MYKYSWVLVILWAFLIFYLSSIPSLQSGFEADFILRKLAHVFVYFVLTILIFDVLWIEFKNKQLSFRRMYFIAGFLAFLYAVSDEIHQTFVPGRNGSPVDVAIDSLGILIGILFLLLLKKFKFILRSKN